MRASRAVVTGEGKLDEQTLQGKLVGEIGTRTRQAGVPLHAIVGTDRLDGFGKRMIDLQMVQEATNIEEMEAAGERLGEALASGDGLTAGVSRFCSAATPPRRKTSVSSSSAIDSALSCCAESIELNAATAAAATSLGRSPSTGSPRSRATPSRRISSSRPSRPFWWAASEGSSMHMRLRSTASSLSSCLTGSEWSSQRRSASIAVSPSGRSSIVSFNDANIASKSKKTTASFDGK